MKDRALGLMNYWPAPLLLATRWWKCWCFVQKKKIHKRNPTFSCTDFLIAFKITPTWICLQANITFRFALITCLLLKLLQLLLFTLVRNLKVLPGRVSEERISEKFWASTDWDGSAQRRRRAGGSSVDWVVAFIAAKLDHKTLETIVAVNVPSGEPRLGCWRRTKRGTKLYNTN